MTCLRRKADRFLEEWLRNSERKPLLVKGARQVGKTETILHFARKNFENVVYINFVERPIFKEITRSGYNPRDILRLVSQFDSSFHFEPERTLIFFDEIQEHPDILTALKFFNTDSDFDVIVSGSLLGIQYGKVRSFSVGHQETYEMRSLDFEEYLWALGYADTFVEDLLAQIREMRPFSDGQMAMFEGMFSDYIVIGGMPAVVREFVRTRTFERTWKVQREILNLYRDDVGKYAETLDRAKIRAVFDQITPQLSNENKKFQYSRISRHARGRDYGGCVEWVRDAGMVNVCHALSSPDIPLEGNYHPDRFKLYMADTGLLIATMDEFSREDVRVNRNLGVYKGAIYENLAAEALAKQEFPLYYFKRDDSKLEIDFVVRSPDGILPIEAKANNNTAKSLRELVKSERYPNVSRGLKFARANIGFVNGITTLPLFCLFLFRRWCDY